jgi:hypothetical protein
MQGNFIPRWGKIAPIHLVKKQFNITSIEKRQQKLKRVKIEGANTCNFLKKKKDYPCT